MKDEGIIKITRRWEAKDATIGIMEWGDLELFTLENLREGVEANRDLRVPPGEYKMEFFKSRRFSHKIGALFNEASREAVRIFNGKVEKSRCILIHAGNNEKDTLGCILLGRKYNIGENEIKESRPAIKEFYSKIKGEDLEKMRLVIKNEFSKN